MVSLAASIVVVAGLLPLGFVAAYGSFTFNGYWKELLRSAAVPAPVALVLTYGFGMVRSAATEKERDLRTRLKRLTKDNWLLKRKSDSLFAVNQELDERVSRQQESITSLYNQLHKIETLDVSEALSALLETIHIFTGATRASVWRYAESESRLSIAATLGWEDESETEATLPLEDTIEGWVFRNNSIFSIRMILEYDNLKKMDRQRNLVTMPLVVGRKVWGVVNIREMPFEKYNLYTERLAHIIIMLAEHSIEEAVSYESIIRKEEVDETTGLPLFSQLYHMLEDEIQRSDVRKGDFSVLLIELLNYGDLTAEHGTGPVKTLIRSVLSELEGLTEHRLHLFHYKEEAQYAIVYPNIDYDGVSLYCLEALEKISSHPWDIAGVTVHLEPVLGFSVYTGESRQIGEMLEKAEGLLEMQKL